jgi:hypothetical protein
LIINLLNNKIIKLNFSINYYYLIFIFLINYKNNLNNKNNLYLKKFKYYKIILDKNINLIIFKSKNYS